MKITRNGQEFILTEDELEAAWLEYNEKVKEELRDDFRDMVVTKLEECAWVAAYKDNEEFIDACVDLVRDYRDSECDPAWIFDESEYGGFRDVIQEAAGKVGIDI